MDRAAEILGIELEHAEQQRQVYSHLPKGGGIALKMTKCDSGVPDKRDYRKWKKQVSQGVIRPKTLCEIRAQRHALEEELQPLEEILKQLYNERELYVREENERTLPGAASVATLVAKTPSACRIICTGVAKGDLNASRIHGTEDGRGC